VHATRDGFTNFEKELLTTWYSRSMARNSPCLLLPAGGICRSAALKSPLMGMLNFACGENEKQVLLPVIDMHGLIRSNAPNPIGPSEIIVARHGARLLGFCVSGLIEVLDVRRNAIEPAVESSRPDEAYVRQIIKRAQ
jgi:chemotaxis signal transduction protein